MYKDEQKDGLIDKYIDKQKDRQIYNTQIYLVYVTEY